MSTLPSSQFFSRTEAEIELNWPMRGDTGSRKRQITRGVRPDAQGDGLATDHPQGLLSGAGIGLDGAGRSASGEPKR